MGFLEVFKKKDVPAELPALSFDQLAKPNVQVSQLRTPALKPLPSAANASVNAYVTIPAPDNELKYKSLPTQPVAPQKQNELIDNIKKSLQEDDDKGFFKEILKTVTSEVKDGDKLNEWYKREVIEGDIVSQMRDYWEKQKPELALKGISKDLRLKLLEKTDRLHGLEQDWQEMYFALLGKEEEIRSEEKELKAALAEFMDLCQKTTSTDKTKS